MTDLAADPGDSRTPTTSHARIPVLAAVVSLFVPGIGHVYAGRPLRGLLAVLGMVAWGAAMLFLSIAVPVRALRILFLVLSPLGRPLVAWDAWRVARPVRHAYSLRGYNRWYVYAGLVVAGWIASQGLFSLLLANVGHAWSIPGTSMEPALLQGDYILMTPRHTGPVPRGELIVYQEPSGEIWIRRVVAVPGDTVEMRHKVLWLNGHAVREPYARHIDPFPCLPQEEMRWQRRFLARAPAGEYKPTRDDWGPLLVPHGQYLALGDNRDNSYDGRWKGFVAARAVAGRPVWIYFSRAPDGSVRWSRIGTTVR